MSSSITLWSTRCELSSLQFQKVRDRLDFWFRLYTGSLYVLIAGAIVSVASIFQLFSLAVSQDASSLLSLIVGIVLSYVAIKILKTVIPFQEMLAETDFARGRRSIEPEWPWNLIITISLLITGVVSGLIAFHLSSAIVDFSLSSSFQATFSGRDELKFLISLIINSLYAGAVVTFISSVMVIWYLNYRVRKGIRYSIHRIRVYIQYNILIKTGSEEYSFEEWLENCCQQCFSTEYNIVSNTEDDGEKSIICSNCGLNRDRKSSMKISIDGPEGRTEDKSVES